jgi:hypothetical protein
MVGVASPRRWGLFLSSALLACSVGCGAKERAVVKGKVTIGTKTLTAGNVIFWGADNMTATAVIDKHGNYAMNDAPVGEVKITVTVPPIPPGGLEKVQNMMKHPGLKGIKSVDPESGKSISIVGDMPATIVPIPDRYGNVSTSNLTYTVQRGEQSYDIPLSP